MENSSRLFLVKREPKQWIYAEEAKYPPFQDWLFQQDTLKTAV